ncbi:MAG: hypothetical protein IKU10_07460 [Clostridia bacterium]|nr:hypothetical protein [Clostridia bacterium]
MPQQKGPCEECDHFIYDEDWDCYTCEIDLDMDDVEKLMSHSHWDCPYFHFRDEYRIVRKQN